MKNSNMRWCTLRLNQKFFTALSAAVILLTPSIAQADSESTAAIVAGAVGIIGALIYDSSNHPYYVNQGRRYYVSDQQANSYRSNHRVTIRRAFVPEQEFPIARGYPGRSDQQPMDRRFQPMNNRGTQPMNNRGTQPMNNRGTQPMNDRGNHPMNNRGEQPMNNRGEQRR